MSNRFLNHDGCFQLTPSSKEEIRESFKQLKNETLQTIESLKTIGRPTWDNLIVPFYNAHVSIENFGGRFTAVYVYSVSNPEYQEIYGELYSDFAELESILASSTHIVEQIAQLKHSAEYQTYDQEQKNYIQSILNKAKNQATLLAKDLKQSISDINNEIAEWEQVFNSNVQKATVAAGIVVYDIADLGDMPQQWVVRASEHFNKKFNKGPHELSTLESGPWYISLTSGVYTPFMEYSRNRLLKKEIYSQKRQIASQGELDNTEPILKLVTKRNELAQRLGFPNFLEKSLELTTANAQQLDQLCASLTTPFKNAQQKLHDVYRKAALQDGIQTLESWDLALYERLHKESLGFNKEEFAEYFPYMELKKGIFKLFEDCFSIKLKEATQEVTTWNPDVEFYRVLDMDGTELGSFYIDPYQRAGEKIVGTQNLGAFCATIRESQIIDQQDVRPVGVLSFAFPVPTQDLPSLCQAEDIAVLFHEFGHLLAVVLKKQSTKTISPSFQLETDAVEFESMMLECWAQVPYILKRLSRHYKTGEPLSDLMIEKLKTFLAQETNERAHGLLGITQVSLALYSTFDPAKDDLQTVVNKIMTDVHASPNFQDDRFVWGCTPLFTLGNYLANTYMYLWAMTVAHTYLMEIESVGWNDESVKAFGQKLKSTLYRHACVGQPMHALKLATGKDMPDFAGFALSRTQH
jgi:oligopeptidase A